MEPLLGVVRYLHNDIESTYRHITRINLGNEPKVFLVQVYLCVVVLFFLQVYMGANSGGVV